MSLRLTPAVRTASIVAVLAGLSLSCPARANNTCALSGKSIIYEVTLCGNTDCQSGRERLTIVGDKVFEYDDGVFGTHGTIYYLGKRVDVTHDPLQAEEQALKPEHPLVYYRTIVTAFYENRLLQTTFEKAIVIRKTDKPGGQITVRRTIQVDSCSTCTVRDAEIVGAGVGAPTQRFKLRDSRQCKIIDTSQVQ